MVEESMIRFIIVFFSPAPRLETHRGCCGSRTESCCCHCTSPSRTTACFRYAHTEACRASEPSLKKSTVKHVIWTSIPKTPQYISFVLHIFTWEVEWLWTTFGTSGSGNMKFTLTNSIFFASSSSWVTSGRWSCWSTIISGNHRISSISRCTCFASSSNVSM